MSKGEWIETAKAVAKDATRPARLGAKFLKDSLSSDPERQRFMREVREQNSQARREKMDAAIKKAKRMVPGIDTDFSWTGAAKAEMRNARSAAGKKLMKMFESKGETPVKRAPINVGEMAAAPKNIEDAMKRRKKALSGDED